MTYSKYLTFSVNILLTILSICKSEDNLNGKCLFIVDDSKVYDFHLLLK